MVRRGKRKSHKEHEKDTDAAKETRETKRRIYKEDMSYWRKDRKLTKRGMDMEILKMKKEPEMEEKKTTNWKRGEKIK